MNKNIELNTDSTNSRDTSLPWDLFQNWVYCICIVTFDLELGQSMEMQYPPHMKLTDKEKSNICYLSFPDSNSGCMGDTSFHFRIRKSGYTRQSKYIQNYNQNCPVSLQSDTGYFYGYVYFRQTKDASIRRGYFQKSVVLISHLPFTNFFTNVVAMLAPQFFEFGQPSLETACHDIDQWPCIVPGQSLNLPMVGKVIQIRVPSKTDKLFATTPDNTETIDSDRFLSSVHEIDLYSVLQQILPHMQMLWELVVLGEPIVIMSSLPGICCMAVQAFISMIWPLKYAKDYRPYFTIHDSEFNEYTTKTQAPPKVILGVTNPFFAKMLQHWPHIVRIGEPSEGLTPNSKTKKTSNIKVLHSKPGVYTKYKPYLVMDKAIVKQVVKGVAQKRPIEIQTAMIRRFLFTLTQNLMMPLERYVSSLMPLQKDICPLKSAPRVSPFNADHFLDGMDSSPNAAQNAPQHTSGVKGDWKSLYRRFIDTENFAIWYRERENEINSTLTTIHVEALSKCDLQLWCKGKAEVQIVDMILRIREKLRMEKYGEISLSTEVIDRLTKSLKCIIVNLPKDLQDVIDK